jgi:hypothetical protein
VRCINLKTSFFGSSSLTYSSILSPYYLLLTPYFSEYAS